MAGALQNVFPQNWVVEGNFRSEFFTAEFYLPRFVEKI